MALEFEKFKLSVTRFGVDACLNMFIRLLPPGSIWKPRKLESSGIIQDAVSAILSWQDDDSVGETKQDTVKTYTDFLDLLAAFLHAFASEVSYFNELVFTLINESDPGVADFLLPDWERVLGLPETCFANLELTWEERQRIAHAKLLAEGQTTTLAWFQAYIESLGYTGTVDEIAVAATARIIGDCVVGDDDIEPTGRMGGDYGHFELLVTVTAATSSISVLECALERVIPAHATVTVVDAT